MSTLIIPCCGIFDKSNPPLWINSNPFDYPLICKIIKDIKPSQFEKIIIVTYKWVENSFHIKEKILPHFRKEIDFLFLEKATSGQAETVYETIKKCQIKGDFVVHDDDVSTIMPKHHYHNFIGGIDITKSNLSAGSIIKKSFITINDQNQIMDIVEKEIKSNLVSFGIYGFKDADEFTNAFITLSRSNYPMKSLFLSHIAAYLIGAKGRVFHFIPIEHYYSWEDSKSFCDLCKSKITIFVTIDFLFDKAARTKMTFFSKRGNSFVLVSKYSISKTKKIVNKYANNIKITQSLYNIDMPSSEVITNIDDLSKYE